MALEKFQEMDPLINGAHGSSADAHQIIFFVNTKHYFTQK